VFLISSERTRQRTEISPLGRAAVAKGIFENKLKRDCLFRSIFERKRKGKMGRAPDPSFMLENFVKAARRVVLAMHGHEK